MLRYSLFLRCLLSMDAKDFCFPHQNKTQINIKKHNVIYIIVHKFSEHSHYLLSLHRYRHSVPGVSKLNFILGELHPVADITDEQLDYIYRQITAAFSRRSSGNVCIISDPVLFAFTFYAIIIWIEACRFVGWTH